MQIQTIRLKKLGTAQGGGHQKITKDHRGGRGGPSKDHVGSQGGGGVMGDHQCTIKEPKKTYSYHNGILKLCDFI